MKNTNTQALSVNPTRRGRSLGENSLKSRARKTVTWWRKPFLMMLMFFGSMLLYPHTGFAQNKMYWTDFSTAKIQRANLDGSSVEDLVTTGLSAPFGIALDVAAGKMYWPDAGTLKIQRANLDGTSVEDLVTGLNPFGIALDVSSVMGKETVFVADNLVHLDRHKPSEGSIHSNGGIQLKKGNPTTLTGNLSAVEDIIIRAKTTVNGDVTAGQDVTVQSGATVNGTIDENASVSAMSLPNPSFSAGGANHTVAQKGSLTLSPGSYGTVMVGKSATLHLSSGDYFFNILDAGVKAVLMIDVSSGEVNVNVVAKLNFNKEAKVQISSGDDDSDEVTFTTLQESRLTIGDKARVLGTIIASNAAVTLAKNSRFRGLLYAKEILVSQGAVFQPHGSATTLPNLTSADDVEDIDASTGSASEDEQIIVITDYALSQNYPNPFNPTTVISFQLPVESNVTLAIYNINGQLVKQVASGKFASGRHQVVWDATDDRGLRVSSGVYLYILRAGEFTAQRKLVLMK